MNDVIVHRYEEPNLKKLKKNKNADCCNCMMAEKTRVVEEEISVEDILQSTPEFELQNVDMEAKSEARRMIEKFVDDNPEAVAGLLKTWLNQEWGG